MDLETPIMFPNEQVEAEELLRRFTMLWAWNIGTENNPECIHCHGKMMHKKDCPVLQAGRLIDIIDKRMNEITGKKAEG